MQPATAYPADDGKGATKAPRRGRVAASATRVLASGRAAAKAVTNTAARTGSAALSAASDLGELVAQASDNTLAITPLTGLQSGDVASGAKSLLKVMSRSPGRMALHYRAT